MIRTTEFQIRDKAEPTLKSIVNRLSTVGNMPVSLNKRIEDTKRGRLQKVLDWFAGIKEEPPRVYYTIETDDTLLIDGRYDLEAVAEQIKRVIKPGDACSITEIDEACDVIHSYAITYDGVILKGV